MRKFLFWSLLSVGLATLIAAPEPPANPDQKVVRVRIADGFDFPVGKPNADGYYKARGFRPNGHLGEDWNGIGGGNSDLGDPVYSIGHGIVVFARDATGGWGNVIVIRHVFYEDGQLKIVDSLYAHLDSVKVIPGQQVIRGQQVGTIGTAHGLYPAHLHFEIHKNIQMGITRNGFARDFTNYYAPSEFINPRRQLPGGGRSTMVVINNFTTPIATSPPSNSGALSKSPSKSASYSGTTVITPPRPNGQKQTPSTFRVDRFGDLDSL